MLTACCTPQAGQKSSVPNSGNVVWLATKNMTQDLNDVAAVYASQKDISLAQYAGIPEYERKYKDVMPCVYNESITINTTKNTLLKITQGTPTNPAQQTVGDSTNTPPPRHSPKKLCKRGLGSHRSMPDPTV